MNDLLARLERLLFQPDSDGGLDRRLGLVLLALVALGAWLIFWPLIPTLIGRAFAALFDLLTAISTALSPPPTPTPIPPSPSPSPVP